MQLLSSVLPAQTVLPLPSVPSLTQRHPCPNSNSSCDPLLIFSLLLSFLPSCTPSQLFLPVSLDGTPRVCGQHWRGQRDPAASYPSSLPSPTYPPTTPLLLPLRCCACDLCRRRRQSSFPFYPQHYLLILLPSRLRRSLSPRDPDLLARPAPAFDTRPRHSIVLPPRPASDLFFLSRLFD